MKEQSFKFCDKVKIIGGFYEGMEGILIAEQTGVPINAEEKYLVRLEASYPRYRETIEILIPVKNFEKVEEK